jgi:hypothetical protein
MRKLSLTAALFAACAVCLVAQEVPGASAPTGFLDTNTYANYFSSAKMRDGRRIIPDKYLNPVSDDDFYRFSVLSKATDDIDTDLEFILLSYYSQPVVNIRPIEAQNMLPANNPRAAGLKLGAAVLKELAELKFLDPSNTAAAGRYEGMIKFISDKNGVSRAEMQDYLRQGIAAVVREKFNEVSFYLQKYSGGFNATLGRDPKTDEYTLTYWGHYTGNVVKTISGNGLDGLLSAMKNTPDFDVMGINLVKEKAEHIPAVVYGSWIDKKLTTVDAVKLAADTVAGFYLNPSRENYDLLVGMFGLFDHKGGDPVAKAGWDAYDKSLAALNAQVREKAGIDSLSKGAALARAMLARNPDYGVFTASSAIE